MSKITSNYTLYMFILNLTLDIFTISHNYMFYHGWASQSQKSHRKRIGGLCPGPGPSFGTMPGLLPCYSFRVLLTSQISYFRTVLRYYDAIIKQDKMILW